MVSVSEDLGITRILRPVGSGLHFVSCSGEGVGRATPDADVEEHPHVSAICQGRLDAFVTDHTSRVHKKHECRPIRARSSPSGWSPACRRPQSIPSTCSTARRRPRTIGLPPKIAGPVVMRVSRTSSEVSPMGPPLTFYGLASRDHLRHACAARPQRVQRWSVRFSAHSHNSPTRRTRPTRTLGLLGLSNRQPLDDVIRRRRRPDVLDAMHHVRRLEDD